MTYLPNIPLPTDLLSDSQKDIRNNFTKANTSFGIDHKAFSDGTVLNGYHTVIHQVPFSTTVTNPPKNQPVANPPIVAGVGEIFTAEIDDGNSIDTALYYLTGGSKIMQLTRNFQPAVAGNNGFTFIPGGFMLNWGRITGLSGNWPAGQQVLTFNNPLVNRNYPLAHYVVLTTFLGPNNGAGGDIAIISTNLSGFDWEFTGSSSAAYDGFIWWSLGI